MWLLSHALLLYQNHFESLVSLDWITRGANGAARMFGTLDLWKYSMRYILMISNPHTINPSALTLVILQTKISRF